MSLTSNDGVNIFILTHKEFEYKQDNIHFPLVCGDNLKDNVTYLKDNSGDNISHLNIYYAELTGEYWAWKNSDADIIGFCHYRRYFSKNFLLNHYVTENQIVNDLKNHDIILPQITHLNKSVKESIESIYESTGMSANIKEFEKVREIINDICPDYIDTFDNVLNGKLCYNNNMFITDRKTANQYFEWLFSILRIMEDKINFEEYDKEKRVLGYLSEVLLTVFVFHNNLKVKERFLILTARKFPHLQILQRRFPFFGKIENAISNTKNR